MRVVRSIGIEVRRDSWVVTVLEAGRSGVRVESSRSIAGPVADRIDELGELLSQGGLKGCRIGVGLPRDRYISRVLRVPAPDHKAIEGVVRFELERHIPFRMDEVCYGFQVLGSDRGLFNVLVTVVGKESLEDLLEPFKGLNARALHVGTTATSIFNALCQWDALPQGERFFLVYVREEVVTIDSFAGCVPVDSREVTRCGEDRKGWMDGLRRELKLAARVMQETTGGGRPQDLLVVSEVPLEDDFFSALGGLTGLPVRHVRPSEFGLGADALASAGTALGALGRGRLSTNLPLPGGATLRRPAAGRTALLACITVLLWASVGVSYLASDLLTIRRLDAAVESLRDDTARLRGLSESLRELDRRIKVLEASDGVAAPGPLDVLKELTRLLPDGTWLTGFEYRDGVVYIDGRSDRASSLILLMERAGLIEDVEFLGKITKGRDGKERFSIKARVKGYVGKI